MNELNTEQPINNQIHSEKIEELARALCKMQSELHAASKSAENPFFNSKYADLDECWKAIRGPLTSNGLAITQLPIKCSQGILLKTMLLHISGQWLSSEMFMKQDKPGAHAAGSILSYARRYSLAAIVGLTQADDDANASTQQPRKQNNAR